MYVASANSQNNSERDNDARADAGVPEDRFADANVIRNYYEPKCGSLVVSRIKARPHA